ncbi:DUF6005 family protein [Bacillus sp. m3-13]|uniref:DUF6005 family protein n=1 Tax=Bacillus sp. m3-13 TaxID=406124 RepID=UPI0001E89A60|nr:DUF6005 family protein [Bacillus sp. m3-13]
MIKVHCFVSCVCEVIKKTDGVDHRPFYFGVWDADFDVSPDGILSYHSENINHDFFKTWYEMLYGIKIHRWYDDKKSKLTNVMTLLELMKNKPSYRSIMVMLDLSMLPERENKFHQNPFPHYVMLVETDDPDEWFMFDPDFRWEGRLPKQKILDAIMVPDVKGGYYFDAEQINPTNTETIEAYFRTCMKHDENPMSEAIRKIVDLFSRGTEKHRRSELSNALKQIPVLAIRKYAYEHAFAFFWEADGYSEEWFEAWCDEIEKLVKGFTAIQYRAMKYAMTADDNVLKEIHEKINEQEKLEYFIKKGLNECFEAWVSNKHTEVLA